MPLPTALRIEPEFGVMIPPDEKFIDLQDRASAACNTAVLLTKHGLKIDPGELDEDVVEELVNSYASDPEKASKSMSHVRTASTNPAVLIETAAILSEFGSLVAKNAEKIRNLVVNKLILESDNSDARIRLRALELLGKLNDVGVFVEKKEVTVTHKTPEEIRNQLRDKLIDLKEVAEGEYEPAD